MSSAVHYIQAVTERRSRDESPRFQMETDRDAARASGAFPR